MLAWSVHPDRLSFGRQRPSQPVGRVREARQLDSDQAGRQLAHHGRRHGHVL